MNGEPMNPDDLDLISPCPTCGRRALYDTEGQRSQVAARRFIRHMFTMAMICFGFTVISLTSLMISWMVAG